LDLGSGPLTIPVALWLSRPELRKKKLTWYCTDISQTALSLGEEIYLSIVAKTLDNENENIEPWKIIRVKGELGTEIRNKASFVTCANMFNELYYDTAKPLEEQAKKYTNTLISYATEKSMILVVEPAFPRSSRFISLTRDALIRKKFSIVSPCPHSKECCMDGRRGGKWCHFVLNTDFAPKKLHKLSDKAGLPKDRASLSFVFAQNFENSQNEELKIRVVSDLIKLPQNATGRYACSKLGLTLVKSNFANSKKFDSGSLIFSEEPTKKIEASTKIDAKSGAKIIEI
jgi:ribosomal protein RSM22 (predicted rRNA methylase)